MVAGILNAARTGGPFPAGNRLPLSSTGHIIAQLGIAILVYSFIHIWLHVNRRALMGLDEETGQMDVPVIEFPPGRESRKADGRAAHFQIPTRG